MGGLIKGLLPVFSTSYSAKLLNQLDPNTVTDCLAASQGHLLAQPVYYTEDNLTPVSVSPLVNSAALTVGNILVAVFGSLFITNAVYHAIGPLSEDYGPIGKVALKAGSFFLLVA